MLDSKFSERKTKNIRSSLVPNTPPVSNLFKTCDAAVAVRDSCGSRKQGKTRKLRRFQLAFRAASLTDCRVPGARCQVPVQGSRAPLNHFSLLSDAC
jgi:hypothetical protein